MRDTLIENMAGMGVELRGKGAQGEITGCRFMKGFKSAVCCWSGADSITMSDCHMEAFGSIVNTAVYYAVLLLSCNKAIISKCRVTRAGKMAHAVVTDGTTDFDIRNLFVEGSVMGVGVCAGAGGIISNCKFLRCGQGVMIAPAPSGTALGKKVVLEYNEYPATSEPIANFGSPKRLDSTRDKAKPVVLDMPKDNIALRKARKEETKKLRKGDYGASSVLCGNCGKPEIVSFLEDGTASGKFKVCSRCKEPHYCSVECQRAAWPSHKPNCELFEGQQ